MAGYIDIKTLAIEYEKVMQMRYEFILENDDNVSFRFGARRFWHFLGFHYLTYSISYKLLEYNYINKSELFHHVKDGNIGLNFIKLDKVITDPNKRVKFEELINGEVLQTEFVPRNFIDASETEREDLHEIIDERWSLFSSQNVSNIFGEEVVLDYENTKGDNLRGKANKIFFKYYSPKRRHLNIVVGFDTGYYPMSYFLESELNRFIFKKDRKTRNETLGVLIQNEYSNNDNKLLRTKINWEKVRASMENTPEYQVHKDLSGVINKPLISSKDVEEKITVIGGLVEDVPPIFTIYDKEVSFECIDKYNKFLCSEYASDKECIETFFMELPTCIDVSEDDNLFKGNCDKKNIKLFYKLERYKEKLELVNKLEIKEIKYIYGKFFDISKPVWTDKFIRQLITDGCYNNKLTLDEIGNRVGEKPQLHS